MFRSPEHAAIVDTKGPQAEPFRAEEAKKKGEEYMKYIEERGENIDR